MFGKNQYQPDKPVSVLFTSKRRPHLGVVVAVAISLPHETTFKDYKSLRPLEVGTFRVIYGNLLEEFFKDL